MRAAISMRDAGRPRQRVLHGKPMEVTPKSLEAYVAIDHDPAIRSTDPGDLRPKVHLIEYGIAVVLEIFEDKCLEIPASVTIQIVLPIELVSSRIATTTEIEESRDQPVPWISYDRKDMKLGPLLLHLKERPIVRAPYVVTVHPHVPLLADVDHAGAGGLWDVLEK